MLTCWSTLCGVNGRCATSAAKLTVNDDEQVDELTFITFFAGYHSA